MSDIRVGEAVAKPTHNLLLRDKNGKELGLLLCDNRGNLTPNGIRQSPMPKTALQTRSGDATYSDYQLPYTPIIQRDWSGGRGQFNFEKDATRFYDSNNLDTSRTGEITLGPLLVVSKEVTSGYTSGKFFEYKGALYFVANKDDGGAPKVFINGYRGLAVANTGHLELIKTGLTLTADALNGCTARLVGGTGSSEIQNWRKVLDTATNGDLTVYIASPSAGKAWLITHDATTQFVIVDSDVWTEISGHGLTVSVTDICIIGEFAYFCQGESVYVRKMKEEDSTGTWTRTWAAENYYAIFMETIYNTAGDLKVWKANNMAGTNNCALVFSGDPQPTWASNITFGSGITCGDQSIKIDNLISYGDPPLPWVLKEDEIGSIGGTSGNIYAAVPLGEMKTVRSEKNGTAAVHWGVYLYFSLLDGIERYYDGRMDDIGPNRDEGIPVTRQGYINRMISYPGRIFAALNAGIGGYSSILAYTGTGWHEVYRSIVLGHTIDDMTIQVIPGGISKLFFDAGGVIARTPVSMNPKLTSGYTYRDQGTVTTSWINCSLAEINKFFKSLTIFAENLSATTYISASYRTDNNQSFTNLATNFTVSPLQEIDLSDAMNVVGRRIQFQITLHTGTSTVSPRVQAIRANVITRVPPASAWTVMFMVADEQQDLQHNKTGLTAKEVYDTLTMWANSEESAAPLKAFLNFDHYLNDKWVFIDPPSLQPLSIVTAPKSATSHIYQMVIYGA